MKRRCQGEVNTRTPLNTGGNLSGNVTAQENGVPPYKGREKIQGRDGAESRLKELLALNETLSTAYVLKEELRELWMCKGLAEATAALDHWITKAWASNVAALKRFADRLLARGYGILNYFRHRVTTGSVEGINNKIKVLKRKAYGFRDIDYFKLRIYFLHESRYALLG